MTRIIDPATWTWSTVATSPFDGHSAVMYRPNKIMKSGTWADPDFNGANSYNADGRTAVIDMNAPTPAWRSTAPMAHGRSYHNMTLLPDGTVLASGGQSASDGINLDQSVLPAEIWNPDTETWTTVASLTNGRLYHSTALLLPDGRVLMAGGGALPGRATDVRNAEIYSPPYLFRGPRPTISAAPATANYGDSFDVMTPNPAQIAKVSLIRSASVTHAFDMNQRFQFLSFTQGAGKVTVQAPATANLAPPGDYLLFLVDTDGVPSVGRFVRVADTVAPSAPSNLSATGSPGQVSLSWTASTDNGGVAHYNVHRSTTAGFTPSQANRIAQPLGTNYVDSNLGAGTYYYKVIAEDGAGNLSPRLERGERNGPRRAGNRRLRLRRRERHDGRRSVRPRQHGHDHKRDLGDERQVRQGALLQRHERLRLGSRLELARPDERNDARGMGEPEPRRRLPDARRQGGAGRPRLRALLELGLEPTAVTGTRRGRSAPPERHRRDPERLLDASCRYL